MLLPQTASQLWIELRGGHQCGLIGGCLLQNASLGLSLQGHQTGLLGLVPGQLTGKVFSRVLPDRVWRACGFPK